jgi:hypothetical protein
MEIWKDIQGYEGLYQVSNIGNVRSLNYSFKRKNGRIINIVGKVLKPSTQTKGYKFLSLCMNGNKKYFLLHRLVAKAFIPNLFNKPEVNHINGIKSDNSAGNLEWVTCLENMKHSYDIGLRNSAKKL